MAVVVNRYLVPIEYSMKYLGLIINRNWSYSEHFEAIILKAERMASALMRLMPNLRGSGERKRRLYANVINSVILYVLKLLTKKIT